MTNTHKRWKKLYGDDAVDPSTVSLEQADFLVKVDTPIFRIFHVAADRILHKLVDMPFLQE